MNDLFFNHYFQNFRFSITLILLSSLFFLLSSCHKEKNNEKSPMFQNLEVLNQHIYKGYCTENYDNDASQHAVVIYNQQDWNHFTSVTENFTWQNPTVTSINFNEEQAIVIFDILMANSGGNRDININSITETYHNIVVNYAITGGEGPLAMPSRLCLVVKIPKSQKPVIFI